MDKDFVRRLDKQALEGLLAGCRDTVEGVIFRLAWKQGLTREEIRSLTWNDLLFSEHKIWSFTGAGEPLRTCLSTCCWRLVF